MNSERMKTEYTRFNQQQNVYTAANDVEEIQKMVQSDAPQGFYDMRASFLDAQQKSNSKRDLRLNGHQGQLPYATTPRTFATPGQDRLVPFSTRDNCTRFTFNEQVASQGPFYLRHWQIFDNAPFKPTAGDITKDPRYNFMTKGRLADYQLVSEGSEPFRYASTVKDRPAPSPTFTGYSFV